MPNPQVLPGIQKSRRALGGIHRPPSPSQVPPYANVFVSAGAPSDTHPNAQISHEDASPEALNFNDPQAVDAAHQTFVNQRLPARWRDALLAAPPTDDDRHAFATLRLRKLADQAQPYPTGMPGDLEQAVTTLANHLSPTGRAEPLQSLQVDGGTMRLPNTSPIRTGGTWPPTYSSRGPRRATSPGATVRPQKMPARRAWRTTGTPPAFKSERAFRHAPRTPLSASGPSP
jgi:hypothetical protein